MVRSVALSTGKEAVFIPARDDLDVQARTSGRYHPLPGLNRPDLCGRIRHS